MTRTELLALAASARTRLVELEREYRNATGDDAADLADDLRKMRGTVDDLEQMARDAR